MGYAGALPQNGRGNSDGLPDVLVRNTFLEVVPELLPLRRVQTTPAGEVVKEPVRNSGAAAPSTARAAQAPQCGVDDATFHDSAEAFQSPREQHQPLPLFLTRLRTGDSLQGLDEHFHSPRETLTSPLESSVDQQAGRSDDCFYSPRQQPQSFCGPDASSSADSWSAELPQLAGEGLSLRVHNTFLDVCPPEPPAPLLRAATTPAPSPPAPGTSACAGGAEGSDLPPQPLPLEQLVTDDRFETPMTLPEAPSAPPPPAPAPLPPALEAGARPVPGPPPPPTDAAPGLGWTLPPPPPPAPPIVELQDPSLPAVPEGEATLPAVCQPNRLTCVEGCWPGWSRVQWAVDARKLEGKDKQAVSPEFVIDMPNHGPASFKVTIYPRPTNDGRGGGGFRKAKGRGRVELKCEARLSASVPDVVFHIGVGIGSKQQPLRGPVTANFLDRTCGGLPKGEEEWDFASSIDETRTFLVFLEIAPPARASAASITG